MQLQPYCVRLRLASPRLFTGLLLGALCACSAPSVPVCMSKLSCGQVQAPRNQDAIQKLALVAQTALGPQMSLSFTQSMGEYRQQHALDSDAALTRRVRAIAARLQPNLFVLYPYAHDFAWEVHVVRSPTLNAYCAPGGKIVFYTGLIKTLKMSDDEIAAVMGHEMIHAADLHGVKSLGSSTLVNLASQVTAQKTGLPPAVMQQVEALVKNGYSRNNEYTADLMGTEVAAMSGFNPHAAVSFHAKLAKLSGSTDVEMLSTHPLGEHRMEELNKIMPQLEALYQESLAAHGKKKSHRKA
jgi:predicted Zn-dependent protease